MALISLGWRTQPFVNQDPPWCRMAVWPWFHVPNKTVVGRWCWICPSSWWEHPRVKTMQDQKSENKDTKVIAEMYYLAAPAFRREKILTWKGYKTLIKKTGNQKMAAQQHQGSACSKEQWRWALPRLIDECLANRNTVVSILMLHPLAH